MSAPHSSACPPHRKDAAFRSTRGSSSSSTRSSHSTTSRSAARRCARSRPCAASTRRQARRSAARAPPRAIRFPRSPRVLGGELQPFQWAGVRYALDARRAFLADEQGLGKTVEALAALEAAGAYPAIVVCPASLKLNWERETARWLPHRFGGGGRTGGRAVPPRGEITILNYEIVGAHRARTRPAGTAGDRHRRVALLQEPARQAHAGGAQAGRHDPAGRAAARADGHAGAQPRRGADRPAAGARTPGGLRHRARASRGSSARSSTACQRSACTGTCAGAASCGG